MPYRSAHHSLRPTRHAVAPRDQRGNRPPAVAAELHHATPRGAHGDSPAVNPAHGQPASTALPEHNEPAYSHRGRSAHPQLRRGTPLHVREARVRARYATNGRTAA